MKSRLAQAWIQCVENFKLQTCLKELRDVRNLVADYLIQTFEDMSVVTHAMLF